MDFSIEDPEQGDASPCESSTLDDGSDAGRLPSGSSTLDDDSNTGRVPAGPSTLDDDSHRERVPSGPSTLDDDPDDERVSTPGSSVPRRPKLWWEDDPEIEAIKAQVEAEIYGRPERPASNSPDPVLTDYLSGNCVRELRNARDDLARARTRYENAVHAGRDAGLSWAQIGVVLGVARQQLHRRFRDRCRDQADF